MQIKLINGVFVTLPVRRKVANNERPNHVRHFTVKNNIYLRVKESKQKMSIVF